MSNVFTIINEYFQRRNVRRIRFKVDPTLKDGFDVATTYEGYVLSENYDEETVIYIPTGDQMGLHDIMGILPIPDRLGPIKDEIAEMLKGKPGEEYLPQIYNSDCFDEIQQYLKHVGYTDEDIIELLKCVITNEGFNPIRAIGKAGEKIADWKERADRYTSYLKTFNPSYLPPSGKSGTTRLPPVTRVRGSTYVVNPALTAAHFKRNPEFISWFDRKYKYGGDLKKVQNLFDSLSNKQLNYYAQKYYEQTGKLIS